MSGVPKAFLDAVAQVQEIAATLVEATVGHRETLLAQGFSPTAAEVLAMEFYKALLAMSLGKKGST